jgi:hypothetical protein
MACAAKADVSCETPNLRNQTSQYATCRTHRRHVRAAMTEYLLCGSSEDILLLAEYFIERYAAKAGKAIRRVDKRTAQLLESYHWPGNIRELQNVIESAAVIGPPAVRCFGYSGHRPDPAGLGQSPLQVYGCSQTISFLP